MTISESQAKPKKSNPNRNNSIVIRIEDIRALGSDYWQYLETYVELINRFPVIKAFNESYSQATGCSEKTAEKYRRVTKGIVNLLRARKDKGNNIEFICIRRADLIRNTTNAKFRRDTKK